MLYGSRKSVGKLCFRAFSASNACFARDEPSSKWVDRVGLGPKPLKLRLSWRCTQPRAAKARASVAAVGENVIGTTCIRPSKKALTTGDQIGLLTQSKQSFSTRFFFSTGQSDSHVQSKKSPIRLDASVELLSRKRS